MTAPVRYAVDRIDVWHVVGAIDACSPRVQSICCAPAFVPARRLVTERPLDESICAACLDTERRRAAAAAASSTTTKAGGTA